MRRIIRKIASKDYTQSTNAQGEEVYEGLGDLSTLADPG
jgi:hypothetical protein